MKKINVLDKQMAELIAAGEVVERPASVVKELTENSIDAGANKITVEIKHGGTSLIRISDNGSGISREDIKNAFLRHATSKLKIPEELDSIETLGFRGEALASICAVSKVEVITFSCDEDIGTRYIINGGTEELIEDAGRAEGTTFIVKDLFFNTPARMKFLKKDTWEANNISGVVDKLALSHPEISFRLIRDGKQTLTSPGDGSIASCVYSVYGKELFERMLEVNYELKGIKVKGFVSDTSAARASRNLQSFFVNGRYVRTVTARTAVEEAFRASIMTGKYPYCAIYIDIPYGLVDVNVHPSKIEIRFADERPVFDAVYYGVKSAIMKSDRKKEVTLEYSVDKQAGVKESFVNNSLKIDSDIKRNISNVCNESVNNKSSEACWGNFPEISIPPSKAYRSDVLGDSANHEFLSNYFSDSIKKGTTGGFLKQEDTHALKSTFPCTDKTNLMPMKESPKKMVTPLHQNFILSDKESKIQKDEITFLKAGFDKKSIIGEVFDCYVVVQNGSNELLLIDKHAAHERLIYERLLRQKDDPDSQNLLEPLTVTLDKNEYSAILENIDMLSKAGYTIEDFGVGTVVLRSIPVYMDISAAADSIVEISEYIIKNKKDSTPEYLDWLYHNMACRAAIKAGKASPSKELLDLVDKLEKNPQITHCPHGRPVYIKITKKEIEKQFGRT